MQPLSEEGRQVGETLPWAAFPAHGWDKKMPPGGRVTFFQDPLQSSNFHWCFKGSTADTVLLILLFRLLVSRGEKG